MVKLPSLGELDQGMAVRIYLCVQPADMRRGFDTLAAAVKEFLRHDPFSGNLFLFVSRGKDRMKILYWEKDGFCETVASVPQECWGRQSEYADVSRCFSHLEDGHGRPRTIRGGCYGRDYAR